MENCVFRGDNGLDPGFRKGRGGGGEVKNGCGEEGRPWVIADAENSLVGEGKNKKKEVDTEQWNGNGDGRGSALSWRFQKSWANRRR